MKDISLAKKHHAGGAHVRFMAALCVSAALTSAADVIQGLNEPNGALAVNSGTTVLTNGFDATLPEALATNAVLWFSADKNVITNEGGGVTEWRDVREAADAETRLYNAAVAYLPEEGDDGYEFRSELPVLVTTNKLFRPDTKAVDFGTYGSGRWLSSTTPTSRRRTAARWPVRVAARRRTRRPPSRQWTGPGGALW